MCVCLLFEGMLPFEVGVKESQEECQHFGVPDFDTITAPPNCLFAVNLV